MQKTLLWAGLFGATAVILGAFGAHALRDVLAPAQLTSYQTGVQYQFYHTLALLAVGIWQLQNPDRALVWAARCFAVGILFFSGSIYLLSFKEWLPTAMRPILGPITPMGGVLFIIGWGMVAKAGRDAIHRVSA